MLLAVAASVLAHGEQRLGEGRRGVFSPDGTRIAFEAVRNGRLAVGVMAADGGMVQWVRADEGFAGLPAWTPDGAIIYTYSLAVNTSFVAARNKPKDDGANLWMWKNGQNTQLTHGRVFDYGASMAADDTIWFATTRGEPDNMKAKRRCVSHIAARPSETDSISIRRHIKMDNNAGVMQPSVSPDGKTLLWAEMYGFRMNWRIVAAPIDKIGENDAVKDYFLTNPHKSSCHSPRWSHDGRMICYVGCGPGESGWTVYVRDMESGKTRRVCAGNNPCFSPDGKSILYDRGGHLYVRRLDEAERPRPKFEKIAQVDHWDFAGQYDVETAKGVNDILNHVLRTGADTIAWRVNAGSMPRHSGREEPVEDLMAPFNPLRIPDNGLMRGHMRLFGVAPAVDTYLAASQECGQRNLGFCAYWPFEENHWHINHVGGWNLAHPQFWCASIKRTPWIGRCSLAFPEVAAHKLRLLDDILAAGPDTLYIEAWRTGGWTVEREYVQPNIDAWKLRYPDEPLPQPSDPRWIALISERQYQFFCDVRRHLDATGRKVRFLLGIYCRYDENDPLYTEKAIDWRRLAKNGIIDGVVIMAVDPDPKRPLESTREIYQSVAKNKGKCQLFCPVSAYCQMRKRGIADYAKMLGITNGEATTKLLELAREVKADGILMECVDYNNYTDEMCNALNAVP